MKFVIVHQHSPEAKKAVEAFIIDAIRRGHKFDAFPVQTPFFQSLQGWPSPGEINQLPIGIQISEIEVVNVGEIVTKRSLIIDID